LKYQRIEYPLLKTENNTFKKISWVEVFQIINKNINKIDGSRCKVVLGNLNDLKSLFLLKKNMNNLGIVNTSYLRLNNQNKINVDLTSNFLFNNSLKSIVDSDLCLIINSNIREEASILNIHLINKLKKGNFIIANIGPKLNFTYPVKHLGISLNVLLKIIQGKHHFCKLLKKAKNPVIIFGNNIILKNNGYFLIEKFKNLSFLKNKNFNYLQNQTSFINFLEVNFSKQYFFNKNFNFYYLFNTDLSNKDFIEITENKNNFIIYQGHHFTEDAQKSNLILPGLSFLEKNGYYINTEGLIQKINKVLKLKTEQKDDVNIFKYIYIYILKKNKIKYNINYLKFLEIFPYALSKKIKIINFYKNNNKKIKININYLNFLIKIYII
jgi:NADH-quinone oxidoreductase subunit G